MRVYIGVASCRKDSGLVGSLMGVAEGVGRLWWVWLRVGVTSLVWDTVSVAKDTSCSSSVAWRKDG